MRTMRIITVRLLMLIPAYRAYQSRRVIARLIEAMPINPNQYVDSTRNAGNSNTYTAEWNASINRVASSHPNGTVKEIK